MLPLFISLTLAGSIVIIGVYGERKVSAFIQDRLGPMEVGKYGSLQLVADLLKLIQKEDIVPTLADRRWFLVAPIVIFVAIFAGYSVMPLSAGLQGSNTPTGVFFLLAIIALDVVGILMAGWASNNKYALFGAMRSVAQMISYEIPLGLSVLAVAMLHQSLDLQVISFNQGIYTQESIQFLGFLNINATGGFLAWNIFQMPLLLLAFGVFFIASLAECNRAPFDLPEAESELVGGFHTEYSGMRWALLFLSEYALMLLVSMLGATLFLGGWNTPLPNIGPLALADWTSGAPNSLWGNVTGLFWLLSKSYALILVQMWVRWTYPRLRVDQLMYLGWKVLTPLSLLLVLFVGLWKVLLG